MIQEDPRVKYHSLRLSALQSDRSGWDAQWEESAARVIPAHRDNFVSRGIGNALGTPGQKKTELQFDATAGLACLRFAAVMESLSTPQNGRWHFLSPAEARQLEAALVTPFRLSCRRARRSHRCSGPTIEV